MMIKQLVVENLVIIDRLDVHFHPGLSVITGETGVGKSIIVNAISLALGGRGKPQWLKPGARRLSVTLDFDADNNAMVREWLNQRQLEQENGDCIVRRTMDESGRSRAYVNSTPVTIGQLKSLGDLLIDISGQNQHQSLTRGERQTSILDARCSHDETLSAMRTACKRYGEAQRRLEEIEVGRQEIMAQKEWLKHQYEEIKNLAPQTGEYETIDKEHQLLSQKEVLMQDLQEAYTRLWENSEARDVYSELSDAKRQIEKHKRLNAHIESAGTQLEEAAILIKQAVDDVRHCLTMVDLSEERLQELNERLSAYHELARKYKVPPEELAKKQAELQEQLEDGDTVEKEIGERRRLMKRMKEEYQELAEAVSKKRRANAQKLSREVADWLGRLGMPDSRLKINFKDRRQQGPRNGGCEDVEFLVLTNRGQTYGTIADLASGGELSRINLAMQLVMRNKQTTPAFLFDEVDVGIGGQVAERMGQLLRELSAAGQLICITHSAAIAACGDQHYQVIKERAKDGTRMDITLLPEKKRPYEIARMMAGSRMTKQSLAHAQAMLKSSRS